LAHVGLLSQDCTVHQVNCCGFFRHFQVQGCLAGFLPLPIADYTTSHHLPPLAGFCAHTHSWLDVQKCAWFARHGTFNNQQIAIAIDAQDGQTAGRRLLAAITARHPLTGVDPSWRCASTDGARLPVVLRTVGHRAAAETVAFLKTCKTATHGVAAYIHFLTSFESR
jgi:hypothetical protein